MSNSANTTTDCRSEEGITVGLIDAIMSISRILGPRLWATNGKFTPAIAEALKDLDGDADFAAIRNSSRIKYHLDGNKHMS